MDLVAVTNLTMTGSEVSHTVAAGVGSVTFQANGANIPLATTSGGSGITIWDGSSVTISDRDVAAKVFYFTASAGTIEVLEIKDMVN